MTWIEKAQPFLLLVSIGVGILLAQGMGVAELAADTIAPLLALMLYTTFLPISFKNFGQTLQNTKVVLTSLAINFVWTPLFAWALGAIFLQQSPDLRVGLILLMVTPCTDWYLVFTGMAKGDVLLGTTLLPINLIFQVLLLPLYLLIFAGTLVDLEPLRLIQTVLWVLFIPLALAILSHRILLGKKGKNGFQKLSPRISRIQTVSLNVAIVAIFASTGNAVLQYRGLFLNLLIPVSFFFLTNFLLAYLASHFLGFSYAEFACLSCTTLARNSPLSLAIAASAFPNRPLITVTLAIAPLIELPILVLISRMLLHFRRQKQFPE